MVRLVSAHAFARQVDAMGIVHEPVEDGVGIGRIAEVVMMPPSLIASCVGFVPAMP